MCTFSRLSHFFHVQSIAISLCYLYFDSEESSLQGSVGCLYGVQWPLISGGARMDWSPLWRNSFTMQMHCSAPVRWC